MRKMEHWTVKLIKKTRAAKDNTDEAKKYLTDVERGRMRTRKIG